MKDKIAIIGGSGFIGSYTLAELCKQQADVTIIDIVPPYRENILDCQFKFIKCDIRDAKEIERIMLHSRFDVVYHFAAIIRAEVCRKDPLLCCDTNITGLANVLSACTKVDIKRFLFSSTTHVYNCETDTPSEDTIIDIRDLTHIYPASKLIGEMLIKSLDIPYTIFRYSIAYGPHGHLDSVVHQFILNAMNNKPLIVHGSGLLGRDFLYVEDHARGNVAALSTNAENEIINLGGKYITIYDAAHAVKNVINPKAEIRIITDKRPGDYVGKRVVSTKASELIGWQPTIDLFEGIVRSYKWLKSQ